MYSKIFINTRHIFSLETLQNLVLLFTGNGYGWKGYYAESLNEAFFRGYKTKKNDMSDVSVYEKCSK